MKRLSVRQAMCWSMWLSSSGAMKNDTVTLYSIQLSKVATHITSTDRYVADWTHIDTTWQPAYQHMCAAMKACTIDIGNHAPIWAWAEPKEKLQQLAEELLSEQDWEQGVSVIELHVPKDVALLSSYFHWNELLDESLETGNVVSSPKLFAIDNLDADDVVQATIPYIKHEWIEATNTLIRK